MQERTNALASSSSCPAAMLHREKYLHPEQAGERFGVRNASIAQHFDRLVERHADRFDELAGVELRPTLIFKTFCEEELDRFIGIGDGGMDYAKSGPVRRAVAGLLQQLALGGVEVRLAGLELAGGQLDEHAAMGVAELALEQHAAVVEDRHDRHGPRVADVFAHALAAVGKAHPGAMHLEERAVVDALPRDEVLGKIFQFRGS